MVKALSIFFVSLMLIGCTYNTNTGKTSFTPFGPGVNEMAKTISTDIKECGVANSNGCKTTSSHDDYEQSKIKAMSNEELEEYIKKKKAKTK